MTWEQMHAFVMGIASQYKGGKGKGGSAGGKGSGYWQELDERQFRRVDKFKGDKDKYKSWLYEVQTGVGRVNPELGKELKELLKKYREEELEYKDFDMENEEDMDPDLYEFYKGQLYGVLVDLTEREGEARRILKGFEDRGEQLDGFKAMLALQDRFDVQTTSSILQALLEVVKPCLLYTSPSPRDATLSRMPSSA